MDSNKKLIEFYENVKQYFGLHEVKYKHYDILSKYIWMRDDYTCQDCGFKPDKRLLDIFGCVLEPFIYDKNHFESHPSWCPIIIHEPLYGIQKTISYKNKIIPKNPCGKCDYFTQYFYEEYE